MPVRKFFSAIKLDEYIRNEVLQLLESNGIYDLAAYGWLDAETPDDQFIGHAIWKTEPPLDFSSDSGNPYLDLRALNSEPWREPLAIAGADFEGLMAAARLSIGLGLFYGNIVKRGFSDESYFELHRMSSMVYLGMAADRIRDVFVLSVFHESADDYGRKDRKRKSYKWPFSQSAELFSNSSKLLSDSLQELPKLAEEVNVFRTQRNAIVHQVASQLGRLEKEAIASSKEPQRITDFNATFESIQKFDRDTEHEQYITSVLKTPIEWYRLLIRFSNLIFIVENQLRNQSALYSPL